MVRIWVRVAEIDPTLAAADVARDIASSTEVLYSRSVDVPTWPPSLENPGQDYSSLLHVIPASS